MSGVTRQMLLIQFDTVKDATQAGHQELDRDHRVQGFTVEHADGTPLTLAEQRQMHESAHEPNRKMASDAEYWSGGHPK